MEKLLLCCLLCAGGSMSGMRGQLSDAQKKLMLWHKHELEVQAMHFFGTSEDWGYWGCCSKLATVRACVLTGNVLYLYKTVDAPYLVCLLCCFFDCATQRDWLRNGIESWVTRYDINTGAFWSYSVDGIRSDHEQCPPTESSRDVERICEIYLKQGGYLKEQCDCLFAVDYDLDTVVCMVPKQCVIYKITRANGIKSVVMPVIPQKLRDVFIRFE